MRNQKSGPIVGTSQVITCGRIGWMLARCQTQTLETASIRVTMHSEHFDCCSSASGTETSDDDEQDADTNYSSVFSHSGDKEENSPSQYGYAEKYSEGESDNPSNSGKFLRKIQCLLDHCLNCSVNFRKQRMALHALQMERDDKACKSSRPIFHCPLPPRVSIQLEPPPPNLRQRHAGCRRYGAGFSDIAFFFHFAQWGSIDVKQKTKHSKEEAWLAFTENAVSESMR